MAEFPWRALVRGVTAAEREHRSRADTLWRDHDVISAVRERGIADGLSIAREHHAQVVAQARAGELGPDPYDGAMHSVWLHGDWRWLTRNMTTEEREAAADAVQRHSNLLNDGDGAGELTSLRWWAE
ncbi:hypothetical protein AMIS_21120 [Actinoplanes missouriensis 431]|uniref:Uncharacterized protein n=1 Tax=Actinoplanes missouriensis (strain ATCC 14538 / DSM 43046 / CBS 188.64 / JCM 3121 / NBRC 102363 / NCIMB 12654 / NRRL B-3342 / UNCC 431) TaxID=512565 RepID=I0H2U5_ACTM4|nr:hypothetical protein AMIS_21120 [Actinoplanes missouriensis 431]